MLYIIAMGMDGYLCQCDDCYCTLVINSHLGNYFHKKIILIIITRM